MKKTFQLTHDKIKPARLAESARCDVRRYFKRSRRRELPEGFNCWQFDCRFGPSEADAKPVEDENILKAMVKAEQDQWKSFYVEILARPGNRPPKSTASAPAEPENDE